MQPDHGSVWPYLLKTTNPTHKEKSANINDIHARGRTFPPRR